MSVRLERECLIAATRDPQDGLDIGDAVRRTEGAAQRRGITTAWTRGARPIVVEIGRRGHILIEDRTAVAQHAGEHVVIVNQHGQRRTLESRRERSRELG
jgi:hypothetical protein